MKELSLNTKELLVVLLLGDGHVGISGNKSFITLEQYIKHESYVVYIHNILTAAGVILHPLKYYSRLDNRHGSINKSLYFKSHNMENLNLLSKMFICNSTKVVPFNIKDWLTPISLAHCICGDGQLVNRGGITICTDNYTLKQVNLLINALEYKFNADCSIHNKKGRSCNVYHRIYIKKTSLKW